MMADACCGADGSMIAVMDDSSAATGSPIVPARGVPKGSAPRPGAIACARDAAGRTGV